MVFEFRRCLTDHVGFGRSNRKWTFEELGCASPQRKSTLDISKFIIPGNEKRAAPASISRNYISR
jgi:hypothetical protein